MDTVETVDPVERQRTFTEPAVLLFLGLMVAFLAAWPLIGEPGFLNTRGGGDSPFLLQRLQQLESALRNGHFPVRWMPDANYGFGYPFFNYYAPLSIYIAALFRFLGYSIVRSIELAQLAGFLVAAWGIFLLARRLLASHWAGFLASVAYTMAPFHMVNIYVRGDSLAEFWAMAWYPWIFLAADRLFDRQGAKFPYGAVVGLAVVYAALVLSHNISALIFTPFLLLFIFIRWLVSIYPSAREGNRSSDTSFANRLVPILIALLLALGLSAWFFIPALAEQDLAQLDPVTEGYFHYSNHFRGVDLLQTTVLFDYDVGGGNAFRMGLVQGLATTIGAVILLYVTFRRHQIQPWIALFILISLFIATLMISPLSRFLWDNLPLLPFTQFPWRFLSIQALFASLAIGAIAKLPRKRLWCTITAILLITAALAGLQTDHLLVADGDITEEGLAAYEWFTGNIGSTVSAEYLPSTVQPRVYSSAWLNGGRKTAVQALSGELLEAQQVEDRATTKSWRVNASEEGATLMFPILQWPGWMAEVNGKTAAIEPAPGSGLITLNVPPAESLVTFHFNRTALRLAAELTSFLAFIIVLFLLFKAGRSAKLKQPTLLIAGFLLLFLFMFRVWPEDQGTAQNLTWDFEQMGYLHHDDQGVAFDNGTILNGYDYDRQTAATGQNIVVTLDLSEAEGREITIELGTPAITWPLFDPEPPIIASQAMDTSNGRNRFELQIPENAPLGLVIPRVMVLDARPLTPAGRARGDLFLRPLHVESEQPNGEQGTRLDVRAIEVVQRDETALDVQLAWQTDRQFSHNYNASLRLIDSEGNWLAQMDAQPGYGFLPSTGWPVGVEVNDWLALNLPQDLSEGSRLNLLVNLYEISSGDVILMRRLGVLLLQDGKWVFQEHEPLFDLPQDLTLKTAIFGELIKLHGYQLERLGEQLRVTLYWQSLSEGQEDYTRYVHVFDPESGEILYQNDSFPQHNSFPTSQWISGEVVSDTIVLNLTDGLPDNYQIGVGFYRQEDDNVLRLTAVDEVTGTAFDDDRVPLLEP